VAIVSDQASRLRALMAAVEGRGETAVGVAPALSVGAPRGLVSFGPPAVRPRIDRAEDRGSASATDERRLAANARPREIRLARAIAVTSGKGGVGKTNIAVNLAACLSQRGRRVCLVDADLSLANADVLCNLVPTLTLEHVVTGRARLSEIMLAAPGGFRLIPGASGVARLAELDDQQRHRLLAQLETLDRVVDTIIIDTAAGISENVLSFVAAADQVYLVTTPEPTAITDGYGMIKALQARQVTTTIHLIVNMARDEAEGRNVHARIERVCQTFLGRSVGFAGTIPMDASVREAVRRRVPFTLHDPAGLASVEIGCLAGRIVAPQSDEATGADAPQGFFGRLARWINRMSGV
jgi:flagellar biosynthesis protein FlhG